MLMCIVLYYLGSSSDSYSSMIPSSKSCCVQPNCKKFKCNPGVMPDESDMVCGENRKLKCDSIYPTDGKCPDGYEIKKIGGGACDGRVPPSCICTMQAVFRDICVKS